MKKGQANGAVIYVRVSTDEQANGPLNLLNQEKRCCDYCKQHGLEVVRVFVDPGESARSTDRPAFQEMLTFCKANRHKIACIVVQDLSRFARNLQDQMQTLYELNAVNIVLRSVYESNMDESPEGKMQAGIFGTFNEYFSNSLSKRMKDRTRQAVLAGRFPWKAPIGYLNTGRKDGANIEPDPKRAPLIRRAFELMSSGIHKKSEVLKTIADEGLLTNRGKPLSPQTFQQVLRNPLYAGWVTLPSDPDFTPVRGLHQSIVTQEQFDCVQAILSGRKPNAAPKRKFNPEVPLKCLVRCAACGEPLTGGLAKGRNKRYARYWCRKKGCRAVKLAAQKLEAEFLGLLQRLVPDSKTVSEFPKIAAKVWAEKQGDTQKQIIRLTSRLDEQKKLRRELRNKFLSGSFSNSEYNEAKVEYDAEIAVIEDELRTLDSQLNTMDVFVRFAELLLMDIAGAWQIAKPEQRQRVQNLLFHDGLQYSPESGILNRSKSCLFTALEQLSDKNGFLASPTGFEPVLPP
jgi:site-specific DNA recombinase